MTETPRSWTMPPDWPNKLYVESPPPVERNAPTMVVLRPGDHVLVCLVDDLPPEEAQEWARSLHMAFRGIEFTIAGGVAGLAILGGGDRG